MNTTPLNDPLAALHPLHTPAPIGWWPPAPGWWLVAVLLLVMLSVIGWWHRRSARRRAALTELRQLERSDVDAARFTARLNQLLRRVALSCFPRDQVAALSGTDWLRFLDAHGGNGFYSGPGRVLATAPYAPDSPCDRAALLALARQWIRQACRRRRT